MAGRWSDDGDVERDSSGRVDEPTFPWGRRIESSCDPIFVGRRSLRRKSERRLTARAVRGHTSDAYDRNERDFRKLAGTRDNVVLSNVSVSEREGKEKGREIGLLFLR